MTTDQFAQSAPPERAARSSAPDLAGWGGVALHALRVAGALGRRVAAVVRPLGWVVIGATAACWVAAVWFGWREILIAAAALTAVLALSALFLIGRSTYEVRLDLTRSRVVVGERAHGALVLRNTGDRAILPSRVVLPVGGGRGVFGISRMAPGDETEELFTIPTHRRQVLTVGPVSIVRGDPFGLFERADSHHEPVDLYVHPRTTPILGQSLGFVRDLEGLTSTAIAPDDISFHALTEYRPGDDLRHVHWRSTARTGTLMVRTYEQTRRSHFVLGLSTAAGEYSEPEEFELAVSSVGSVGLRALSDSFAVDLRTPGDDMAPQNSRRLLDALSGVEQSRPREGGIAELGADISADLPLASVVVLVCGGRATTAQLREAVARVPHGVRCLVVVARAGAEPELQRIGEADVVTVGSLDDLPATVRRVLA
ncbi:DUF58 domain-containing protein [Microbacterium halophytorum]|uniref:DUF58 domain-containing protein n=1 Tax=Microbacterium halophytorum TaxID=2067568 RepID=UPI000CFD61E1|nr:DUF58 domain-containing protein [Microbacterium halophytorum]